MHLKNVDQGVLLEVKLFPSSKVNKIVKIENERLYIKVTAAAFENKANQALILILSKTFRVPKTSIQIIKGEKSKVKTVLIVGKKQQDILLILEESI
jgi:uncharacterized protein (TIGR00251 family)